MNDVDRGHLDELKLCVRKMLCEVIKRSSLDLTCVIRGNETEQRAQMKLRRDALRFIKSDEFDLCCNMLKLSARKMRRGIFQKALKDMERKFVGGELKASYFEQMQRNLESINEHKRQKSLF